MPRYPKRFFDLDCSRWRDSVDPPGFPRSTPFIDRTASHAELGPELWPRACFLDCHVDRISVHAAKFGTDCSGCQGAIFRRQPTESSGSLRNAKSMDHKKAFAARLMIALDAAGVETKNADRKRYIAALAGISERQAGNYLAGEKLPTPDGMIDLATKLGVNPNWLWAGYGPMKALTDAQTAHIEALQSLPEAEQSRVFSVSEALVSTYTVPKAQAS